MRRQWPGRAGGPGALAPPAPGRAAGHRPGAAQAAQAHVAPAARSPAPPVPPDRRRPPPGGDPGPDPRGCPGCPRRGDAPGGGHRGPERDPLRAGAGPRRQGAKGHRPATRHRLRPGRGRRPPDRAYPGALGHRRRGTQPPAPDRGPGRHPVVPRSRRRPPPPGGGRRTGHRRAFGAGQPGRDAPPAHRRVHRVGQVVLHQFDVDVGAGTRHPRPGAPDPGRPQAGGAGPLQRPAPPAHGAGDQPEESGQRPALGRAGDGAALRPAGRGRHARHNRLQRGLGPGRPGRAPARPTSTTGPAEPADRDGADQAGSRRHDGAPATSACRSSWWSSTSSTTS